MWVGSGLFRGSRTLTAEGVEEVDAWLRKPRELAATFYGTDSACVNAGAAHNIAHDLFTAPCVVLLS